MSLAWQTPVSSQPSLVGIAVARTHFTAELIAQSREFVLNVPGGPIFAPSGRKRQHLGGASNR